jgi:hypothetical protein
MATELRELRRLVGDKLGDMVVLKATHVSGTTDTVRDTVHLPDRGDDAASIVSRLLYFSRGTGANLQHEAAVTGFAGTTKIITFTPAAPSTPQAGDEVELWAVAEKLPGGVGAIHRLINYAIGQVSRIAGLEELSDDVTFDANTGTVDIPSSWRGGVFGGAEFVEPDGYIREVRERYLRVRPSARTVEIWGAPARRANRRTVRLYGYPPVTSLSLETDTTPVNDEWIVESVAGALTLARSWASNDAAAAERRANYWSSQAMLYRRNIASARRGLGIAIP